MPKLHRTWIAFLSVAVLTVGAGIAAADDLEVAEPEAVEEDTVVSFGYDKENHIFMFRTSSTDPSVDMYDCTTAGELSTTYGAALEGAIPVDALTHGEGTPLAFPAREAGVDPDAAEYDGADGPCGLFGTEIAGPNGQINHGMFMKALHEMIEPGQHRCLNRLIARSELGKGDQQLKTGDVDPEFEISADGTASFTSALVTCEKKEKPEKGEDHPSNKGPDHPSNKAKKNR